MPFSPSQNYETSMKMVERSQQQMQQHRQQRHCIDPSDYRIDDDKWQRFEKLLEHQQAEIDFLRAKLQEVEMTAQRSGTALPPVVYPAAPMAPYPSNIYYGPAPDPRMVGSYFAAPPYQQRYPTLNGEREMRPSSAAPNMFRDARFDDYSSDEHRRLDDYWKSEKGGNLVDQSPMYHRPQSSMDKWQQHGQEIGIGRAHRLPGHRNSSTSSSNSNSSTGMGRGRGGCNFRGSGFQRSSTTRLNVPQPLPNLKDLGLQTRDSIGLMKDSGFPRSSSPNESITSTDSQNNIFNPRFRPNSRCDPISIRTLPPKQKGLVDESFMSQTAEQQLAPKPGKVENVRTEPRPASSILKGSEMVDEASFNSRDSLNNNNGKSVSFKPDAEVAALSRRSPFITGGEKTPSPTSSASSSINEALNLSSLTPSDKNALGQITHVNSPWEFFVVTYEDAMLHHALQDYGNDKNSKRIFDASRLGYGELCIVKFIDGEWYRATVLTPGKNPELFLFDYGDSYVVPDPCHENLRIFDSTFIKWPIQGYLAQLAGVVPPGRDGTETWPQSSTDEFKQLTENQVVTVSIVDGDQLPPSVHLERQKDGVDISDELVSIAYARKI